MKKQELLQLIQQFSSRKDITREEIIAAYEAGKDYSVAEKVHHKLDSTIILYYVGAAITALGISILVWQNWDHLNIVTKILATIGVGFTAYIVGFFSHQVARANILCPAFFLISGLLMPIGLFIVFDHLGFHVKSDGMQSIGYLE